MLLSLVSEHTIDPSLNALWFLRQYITPDLIFTKSECYHIANTHILEAVL